MVRFRRKKKMAARRARMGFPSIVDEHQRAHSKDLSTRPKNTLQVHSSKTTRAAALMHGAPPTSYFQQLISTQMIHQVITCCSQFIHGTQKSSNRQGLLPRGHRNVRPQYAALLLLGSPVLSPHSRPRFDKSQSKRHEKIPHCHCHRISLPQSNDKFQEKPRE